jgi:hypothetical protein
MAIEKEPINIDQDGAIDIEIMDMLQGQAPQENMGMEVQLPEEMNIQGEIKNLDKIGLIPLVKV